VEYRLCPMAICPGSVFRVSDAGGHKALSKLIWPPEGDYRFLLLHILLAKYFSFLLYFITYLLPVNIFKFDK